MDPRLDPAYYVYYYSQRPLDPRLPPPLNPPYPGTAFSHYPYLQQPNGKQNKRSN